MCAPSPGRGYDSDFSRELGRKGWLGLTLPKEYGGGGRSPYARYVMVEEFLNFGAPGGLALDRRPPERAADPEVRHARRKSSFYIPPVCRGESFFCIGMSEPNAGSDLASVKTRATRNGKGWALNGQKIWTTNAHNCHYMIALVRTSGTAEDRQQGPVAADRRPEAAGRDGAADHRPRPAIRISARSFSTTCSWPGTR